MPAQFARALACTIAVVGTSCYMSHEPRPPLEDASAPRWVTCDEYARSQAFPRTRGREGDTCDPAAFGECTSGVFPSPFPDECSRMVASCPGGRVAEQRVFGPGPGC